jgi:hypothetical protein
MAVYRSLSNEVSEYDLGLYIRWRFKRKLVVTVPQYGSIPGWKERYRRLWWARSGSQGLDHLYVLRDTVLLDCDAYTDFMLFLEQTGIEWHCEFDSNTRLHFLYSSEPSLDVYAKLLGVWRLYDKVVKFTDCRHA